MISKLHKEPDAGFLAGREIPRWVRDFPKLPRSSQQVSGCCQGVL
ncbi:hypothetical protein A2U01_0096134, partial [Trifolium medium]|nr:hypothetical protein [Trifolium medium]